MIAKMNQKLTMLIPLHSTWKLE